MGLLLWVVFGAIAGWVASVAMKTDPAQGTLTDIILGVVGAIVGGLIMESLGYSGITGFNIYSLLVAIFGAVVLLYVGRLLHR